MALTETRPQTAPVGGSTAVTTDARTQPTAVEKVLGSGDHKTIGRIYIGASLLFAVTDLVLAGLVNLQAAGSDILEASVNNRFGLNHPLGLMLCGAMGLLVGLGIYLVPLQVGSPSIAFPRAAAMSLWGWLLGTGLFTTALLAKGSYGGSSEKMTRLGHVSVGLLMVSLLVGTMCIMVTVMSNRAAGMTISRVPFFSFSMLAAGSVWMLTLPVALASMTIWQIRQPSPIDLEVGAYPAIEWLFHQPTIFMLAIPILGLFADICGGISGQRQQAYTAVQGLIIAFAALSFGAWAQTFEARETLMWVVAALAVILPTLGVLGAGLDTLRRGKVAVNAGLALGTASMLLLLVAIGAGAVEAISTIGDGDLFNTAAGGFAGDGPGIAIGQFYLIIAAVVVAGMGASFHWGSRIVRGGLPSGMGMLLAPLALLGGLAFGLGHIIMGLALPDQSGSEALAAISGVGAFVLALSALVAFALYLGGAAGRLGGDTDTVSEKGPESTAGTFEWLTSSPPVANNFIEDLPVVESEYPLLDTNEQGAK